MVFYFPLMVLEKLTLCHKLFLLFIMAAENYMMQRPLGVTVELILGGGDNGSNSSIVTGLSNRQLISDLPRDFEDW